ncbi:MAG TPA: ATP-binding protein [Nitrospira sp.]|nr:ATP-binding protein [Nitrospira sp.]
MTTLSQTPRDASPLTGGKIASLRTKFVVFFSLILILTCSTLSWYFIEVRRVSMTENLNQLGTILLTSVVKNGQFRYGGLIAEDRTTLREFVDSLMAVDDVVYVVIRGADHLILAQENKIVRESSGSVTFSQERRYYPDEAIAEELYRQPTTTPRITPVALSPEKLLVPDGGSSDALWIVSSLTEKVYDFALPVMRKPSSDPSLSPMLLEMEERIASKKSAAPYLVQGVVQIGISDAGVKRALFDMIRNVLILTTLLISAGILGAHFLTLRVTTPLRKLAAVARQLAEGESPPPIPATTGDEVGQLTQTFNVMTEALKERSEAITSNLETIRKQITQLTAVHQTSAAITSTLDLHELMDTVLQLLRSNLGFSRMALMLRHEDREVGYVAQVAGVSDEITEAARFLTVPIKDDDTILADLFIHAKPVLARDVNTVAHRMHPALLDLARRVDLQSFVCVPLQSHSQILGFIAGDRGAMACSEEDLHILMTIASHVATAIDNARTYADLAQLTQHLEQRIQERTKELSVANERLQEHDRRRTMFVSVASHELRTPMTAIRSFADNMLDGVAGALSERQKTYLDRIGHNLNRLTRIINQLLDWSRLDLNKEILRLESLRVDEVATVVVESLRTVAAEKHVEIQIDAPEHLPMIHADRDKVEQILWNIIGNAVKFTPPGGRVSVGFQTAADGMVQTCVNDTGCGIPPEQLDRVFDEFSKVASTMPTSQGAQLGLFITKSFISMHKGRIWVESEVGAGSRFYFTLPGNAAGSPMAQSSPEIVSPGSATDAPSRGARG